MKLTLEGDVRSKKNSKRVYCRGKYPRVLPSVAYERWHREKMLLLKKDKPKKPIQKAEITITFYPSTLRKFDLSNHAESVMDLLVDVEYLKDDNWKVVPKLTLLFGEKDKENARAIVEINVL